QWMLKKLRAAGDTVRVKYFHDASVEIGRREWSYTGVIEDFHVERHDPASHENRPSFEVWITFKGGARRHAQGLTQFADGYYGMNNGMHPPNDVSLKFEPAKDGGIVRRVLDALFGG
ncbi:MAG: hypothetical protein ABEN55_20355, partial [Bradymonadaceae bacterium]